MGIRETIKLGCNMGLIAFAIAATLAGGSLCADPDPVFA